MKKYSLCFVGIMSLIFAAANFAEPTVGKTINTGYSSSLHPILNAAKTAATTRYPALTDITVVNASSNVIHVSVPNTPITDDVLYPRSAPDHIRNYDDALYTTIQINDPYGNLFFANSVCERAIIVVYGSPNAYTINVDNEFCGFRAKSN